ncbi:MAG: FHA domain-containing protein, partial [Thermoleophilia bacterium]|nr:FHA domain-containing protein [Thermoleophilia bacterium]
DEEPLLAKFEHHLAKYVKSKGYRIAGEISVTMTCDPDLRPGYFGILAERDALGLAEQDLPLPMRARQERQARSESIAAARPEQALMARSEQVMASRPARVAGGRAETVSGATAVIPAADAAQLGLAHQTLVVKTGNRVVEFNQGRVILGRAHNVDFVIDNPDVSRRHAVLYWSNGDIILEDLGSTNGTMVNGYPISSTVVGPGDVVTIGDCRLTVGTR